MTTKTLLPLFFLCCLACKNKRQDIKPEKFDKTKWEIRKNEQYLYRDKMLPDLIANYTLKGLKKEEVVNMLGEPNRTDNGHLFYAIAEEHLGSTSIILHTKTLVIKLGKDSTVEWRKIHE